MSEAKPQFDPSKPFQPFEQSGKPKFDPNKPWDEPSAPAREVSGLLPTIVDKFAQGGSLGFADEISGLGEAAGRAVGVQGLGGKIKDMKMADDGPTLDFQKLKDAYIQGRDKDREVLRQEKSDHPIASGLTELAGSLFNPVSKLFPGGVGIKGAAKTGAMLGGAAGLGYSDANNVSDLAKDTAIGATLGGVTGAAIPAVLGGAKNLINNGSRSAINSIAGKVGASGEYTPIANKTAVLDAAEKLGVTLPKGVLTDNPTFQKLESGLAQSPTKVATSTRDLYNNLFKGLEGASEKISDLKTPESEFSIGKNIQKDLADQVSKLKEPTSALYNEVMPDLQKIPVDESVVNKAIGQLKKQPIFQTKDGMAFLEEHAPLIKDTPELASLKEYRSSLGDLTNQNSLPVDVKRVDALQKAVTKIRDNSLEAQKAQFPKSAHGEIDDLIGKVSLADASHASNIEDINSIKSLIGNKDFGSPSTFLNKLGDMKEADLAQKAANLDVTSMNNLKEKFPSIYEQAKMAKVNDMIQRSTNPTKGFNDQSFMKQYSNLDQEMKDLLFDSNMQKHIDAIQTVKSAIPAKLGPSGTPEGLNYKGIYSPQQNALDYGTKKALDTISSSGQPAAVIEANPKVLPFIKRSLPVLTPATPTTAPSSAIEFQKAADKNKPTKGPDKWAADGLQKVQAHDSSAFSDPSVIEQILGSKKGKDLLIRASDLKPNTKAMDKLVDQIKSASISGGE